MSTVRTLAVATMFVFVAARAPAATGAKVKQGPHFRVICHFDDDASAESALETVEAIWPAASQLYGLAPGPLAAPLNVHLFRRPADYLVEERNLAAGDFDRNLAFWSFDTHAAYVAVQPDLTEETFAALGLTAQTRHLLCHEAAHLVRDLASPSARFHPNWLCDGAAIWIEEQATAARGWSVGDDDPYVAHDAVLAQRLLANGRLPSAAQILKDEIKDMEMYERYAVRKLFFHRLITRKDAPAFREALAKALKIEPSPEFAARFLDVVSAPYAAEGFDGLSLDFEQFVRSLTPAWEEVHRSLSTAGDAWAQTAFADQNAIAWRTSPVGADAYEGRGQIEILPGTGKAQQMNLLLGREKDVGFVSVAFVAGYGADVFFFDAREDKWLRLATGPTRAVQLWRRVAFRAVVGGDKLKLSVDGVDVATADLKGHAMSGAWGLGVQAGCAGLWRNVKIEPTKTR